MLKFGEYIESKRKHLGITLRQMASELEISAPYLSDIEKSRRNPPDLILLQKIAVILCFSEKEWIEMFELAGQDRKEVPVDIADYIMATPIVSKALRKAKEVATEEDWVKFIEVLDNK